MQKVSNRKVDISHEASTRNDYELIHVYDLEGMTGMKEEKFEKQLENYRARYCHVTVHIISKNGWLPVGSKTTMSTILYFFALFF